MSWPADGQPRFKATGPYGVSRGQSCALVLDRAYNHRPAAACRSGSLVAAAALAAAKAVRMNLADDPWYQPVAEEAA